MFYETLAGDNRFFQETIYVSWGKLYGVYAKVKTNLGVPWTEKWVSWEILITDKDEYYTLT